MAILSLFYGIIISMFYGDNKQHKQPHIHVRYQGMNPEVIKVKPEKEYTLHLWFTNGEEGILDSMKIPHPPIIRDTN